MDNEGRTSFAVLAGLLAQDVQRSQVEKRAHKLYATLSNKTRQGSGNSMDGPPTMRAAICLLLAQELLSTASSEDIYQRLSGVSMKQFRSCLKQARSLLSPASESTTPTRQLRSSQPLPSSSKPVPSSSTRKRPAETTPTSRKSSAKKSKIELPKEGSKDAAVSSLLIKDPTSRSSRSSGLPEVVIEVEAAPTESATPSSSPTKKKATPKKTPKKSPKKSIDVTPTPVRQVEGPAELGQEEEQDGEWRKTETRVVYKPVFDFELQGEERWQSVVQVEKMWEWWDELRPRVEGLMGD